MSRDGYEYWDNQPDGRESSRRDSRGGRRSRRSAAAEESWPAGSPPGQGSGEYYDPAGYTDQGGYADQGGGYPGGYEGSGSYGSAGQYYDSGGHSARALPAGSGGYDGYPDSGYQGGDDPGYGDGGYPGGYRDNGYGDQGYSEPGYREAGYPGEEYPGYGGRDPYGAEEQYGGQFAESAGYDTGGGYPAQEGYSHGPGVHQPGAAGYEHGGGYDDGESFGWPGSVDDTGIARRRGRAGEDEIDADSARHNQFFRGFGGGDDDYGHRPPKKQKKQKKRRSKAPMVALTVLVLFLAGIAGGGLYAYKWYTKRHADWTGSAGTGSVTITVKQGEFACSPGLENTLVNAGVVASAQAFCDAAQNAGNSNSLKPGSFRLHEHMGAALAWKLLLNPKSQVQTGILVPPGQPTFKVIALLAKGTGKPLSQFTAALKDTSALGLPSYAQGNPEGFLYPATYNFQPGETALDMLKEMVAQFKAQISSVNLTAAARKAQISPYHIIIEASLLEGEVGPKYFADVARVIDNRLNSVPPMALGLDSTIAFITHDYTFNLSNSQLHVNSKYNTITHTGLPPGPIDSPDVEAIKAALHPNDSATAKTWLYFVTVNKVGKTLFTPSFSQFQIWSNEAKKALG